MDYKIKIHSNSETYEHIAAEGTNLLKLLRQNNYEMYTPCNGQGTCGKCSVKLDNCTIPAPSLKEQKLLGDKAISEGSRLACRTVIQSDMDVYLDNTSFKAKVLTEGKQNNVMISPVVTKKFAALSPASLQDQRSDSKRLSDFLSLEKEPVSLDLIRQLPEVLRKENYNITFVFNNEQLIGLESGDTTSKLFGVAVDIGTTTMAAYLLNMVTGERLATYSCLNPQKKFGADVIARIKHSIEAHDGLDEMHSTIIDGINLAVKNLAETAGIEISDIYEITLVGNTTMMHFLLKLPAKNIASSPFIPAATQTFSVRASELGIQLNKNAVAIAVPSVAAYIGADTVSAVLASGMNKNKSISLLVDFGTNGEIVLGNSERLLSCSAAAGPAFEGANIKHGVGGIRGAIDSFKIDGVSKYSTIEDEKPVGICGTGLVDIVSELYKANILDETGRMETDPDELGDLDERLKSKVARIDGMASFIVADEKETENRQQIIVTQKDVRELQNAKAAIAAGIRVLAKRADIRLEDIEAVYLAGGFGSYINQESATNIGLIPQELRGRIESIGNAAGVGAIEVLLSKNSLLESEEIKNKIEYIELSASKDFNDYFIDSMIFSEV